METSLAKPIARLALLQNGRLIYFLVAIVFKSFLRIVRSVSSLLKNQHFQIPIRSGKTARTKTSLYRADVAFSINLLIYLTLQLQGEKYKNNPILFRYSFFPTVSVGRHAIFFSKRLNEKDCVTRQGNVQKMLIPTGLLPKVATVNEVKTQSHASLLICMTCASSLVTWGFQMTTPMSRMKVTPVTVTRILWMTVN